MTALSSRERRAGDACPGVSRPFVAVDGSIVRLRPAGQPVRIDALATLMEVIAGQPDPSIQLTSRGALQLRGLPDPLTPRVRDAIRATGLAPSTTHELVRNIVASPLSGLDDAGHGDLRPVTRALDAALCAAPALARLGGRFLVVLDDGRGDVVGESFDLGMVATGPGRCVVLAGGVDRGWEVPLAAAVPRLLALAHEFVEQASGDESVWHVGDLTEPLGTGPTASLDGPPPPERPLGAVGDHAVVAVPLGLLRPVHVTALASVTDRVLVTPWRSLVIEHGAAALPDLEAAGLVTRAGSPWTRLHACTGLPGCARSALDTRTLARDLAPLLPSGHSPVHVSGCERRCGTPATAYVDVLTPRSTEEALSTIAEQESSWT
ncbi:precorrin-3B synthase [Humibacillus xanthopallidus]|uniref:precorrin-3B synthase n=1 Tax=Humibacillus xanthopallidus TaxID=412689 RepID=UPI001FE7F47B|nr:precorrin-3B synthase [Humibacillus xanthopallidus]